MKVIFGTGKAGKMAVERYGKENVRLFIDNYKSGVLDGINVLSLSDYVKESYKNDDEIIVAAFGEIKEEMIKQLSEKGLSYQLYYDIDEERGIGACIHIFGRYPQIRITAERKALEKDNVYHRAFLTAELFRVVLRKFSDELKNYELDLYVHTGDKPDSAYKYLIEKGLDYIFAYSTVDAYKNLVIPIPDYRCFYMNDAYYFEEDMETSIREANKQIDDCRIYWRGSTWTSESRRWLKILADNNPTVLKVEEYDGKTYIPMSANTNYKYSLDIRGYGFTDRVNNLFWLNRPIFLVDRPYRQWYYDKLEPMVNYIPVREDLSDLLEKYKGLEGRSEKYNEIRKSMSKLCKSVLSPNAVLQYTASMIFKYGKS